MKRNWTRRKFLESTLKGSIAASGAVTAGIIIPAEGRAGYAGQQSSDTFDVQQRNLLRAAMDEIIPAGDGMPAASEVGGVEYLTRIAHENPKIKKDLLHSLGMLSELSRKGLGKEFTSLIHPERVEALKKFEALRPRQNFAKLRDYIYEAYYTQPKVWTQLGYSFHPTNSAGPRMKPFDPSSLDRVRKMGKLYREVS
ncbi:MAG TPA: gluconate 2-dehydrogenase subunit 3 family protein [Terriglobia bacterium]|nr:gluconate 2-dehydrogenase subunit 3 family protein [Terriglobia bacterium]